MGGERFEDVSPPPASSPSRGGWDFWSAFNRHSLESLAFKEKSSSSRRLQLRSDEVNSEYLRVGKTYKEEKRFSYRREGGQSLCLIVYPSNGERSSDQRWMSHDARWFMAVAKHFGMDAANRLNQSVCREIGRVEMKRYMKTLALSPAENLEEYLTLMKAALSLYGSGLAEYEIRALDDESYEVLMKDVLPTKIL